MSVKTQEMLIRTGESLDSWGKDIVYDFPVESSGFKSVLVKVPLDNDKVIIDNLIPEFEYQLSKLSVQEATCILDGDQANLPIAALVKGFYFKTVWDEKYVTVRNPVISIARLCFSPQQVILSSSETAPLENTGSPWPGYSLASHGKNLKLGLETISVKKKGEQFIISFPEGDEV